MVGGFDATRKGNIVDSRRVNSDCGTNVLFDGRHEVMKRVLVVDDDPGILALVTTWLETAGYGVETAGNFAAAKLHVSRPKEVLIVDVRLEAFNGLQLAILAHSSDSTMRIVVMS